MSEPTLLPGSPGNPGRRTAVEIPRRLHQHLAYSSLRLSVSVLEGMLVTHDRSFGPGTSYLVSSRMEGPSHAID